MFVTEGTLLVVLWEFVNKTFDVYLAQEPLKNDVPITNDSTDPNGSLLNGLKSKKDTVRVRGSETITTFVANTLRPSLSGS